MSIAHHFQSSEYFIIGKQITFKLVLVLMRPYSCNIAIALFPYFLALQDTPSDLAFFS